MFNYKIKEEILQSNYIDKSCVIIMSNINNKNLYTKN